MSQAAEVLSSAGWLSRQDEAFRQTLFEGAILQELAPGEAAYDLAADADGFYGLADGFLDVLIGPQETTPTLAHVARPGWWFGEAALINGSPRRGHISARTDCTLVFIPEWHITELRKRDDETWRRIAGITVDQLDLALAIAVGIGQSTPEGKVRASLRRLFDPGDPTLELPVSQSEIAEISGLSRNAAGAALKALEQSGVVEVGYRKLKLWRYADC